MNTLVKMIHKKNINSLPFINTNAYIIQGLPFKMFRSWLKLIINAISNPILKSLILRTTKKYH